MTTTETRIARPHRASARPAKGAGTHRQRSGPRAWATLFAFPYLAHLLVLTAWPVLALAYLSFTDYDTINTPSWIGLDNFTRLLGDAAFWKTLLNTAYFAVLFVPAQTILALLLAVALNQRLRWISLLRGAYFVPVISSWVVVAYVADAVFNPQFGMANTLLRWLGLPEQVWLQSPALVIPTLALVAVWKGVGYMMVLFLAGLQNIPQERYEAAEIDGASAWQRFRYITLPGVSATTFLVLVLSTITTLQAFEQVYVMTNGGPNRRRQRVTVLYMYQQGFEFFHMGYAAAVAWVLFGLIFILTASSSSCRRGGCTMREDVAGRAGRGRRGRRGRAAAYLFVWAGAAVMVLPFLASVSNSLKSFAQYIAVPPTWLPSPPHWSNYTEVWERAPFGRYAWNSFLIATLAVIGNVITSSMVGHALARMRLPGRQVLLAAALGTLMLPTVVTIIPNFILFKHLGWLDTILPLVVPYWLATPFGIFLMRQTFLGIPRDFEEAAAIDGANPWQIFWRVHMPLAKPALATLGVFTFMASWGAVLEPTIYLISPEKYTLPIGVMSLKGGFRGNDQLVTAAALMSLVPMLLLFLLAQRYFVRGAIASGLKG